MKSFLLTLFTFIFSSMAIGQDLEMPPTPDSLQKWVDERVKNANEGKKERVEVVWAVRTLAWGCLCPDNYIGIDPNMNQGPYLSPVAPKNFPVSDTIGYSLIVEGYFTGKIIDIDYRNEEGEPAEWLYHVPEFVVTKWRKNKKGYDATWFRVK